MCDSGIGTAACAATVERVRAFFDANPDLWSELVAEARRHVATGARFGVQTAIERWRWYRPVVSGGEAFRLDNTWGAVIARLLVEAVPECRPFIELRRSRFDGFFTAVEVGHG